MLSSAPSLVFTCPFVRRPDFDDEVLDTHAQTLQVAFRILFTNQIHTLSYCDLYYVVYTLTIGRRGDVVHDLVKESIAAHARATDSVAEFWKGVRALTDVCMFLYRHHPTLTSQSVEDTATDELSKRKRRALDHLRRICPLVGRLRLFFLQLHTHVHYKPNGRGEACAKAEFESVARQCTRKDDEQQADQAPMHP